MMIFVTLLTLLSLLFALIEMEWKWSSGGNGLIHAILGIIVVLCSCFNVIIKLIYIYISNYYLKLLEIYIIIFTCSDNF